MKVIKNINNNVALCLDASNTEVIVFGKGVGFAKPPYEVEEKNIQRMYYDVDRNYFRLIQDLSPEIIDISTQVIDNAKDKLSYSLSPNVVFTLADHIQFAIQREKDNMDIKLPILHDVKYFFKTEMDIGRNALIIIKKQMKVTLPKKEAAYIALHLINSQMMSQNKTDQKYDEDIIEDITKMIEEGFHLQIDKNSFNYSRFVSHMHYLLKRGEVNEQIKSENVQLYDSIQKQYPLTRKCSSRIADYLKKNLKYDLSKEEILYLMLHINRLCTREDCYQ